MELEERPISIRVMLAHQIQETGREVVSRTRGRTRGPITRLMSPSGLGEVIKPFVFLDLAMFDAGAPRAPMELLWHPHSGIATVTVVLEGGVRFAETTGKQGVLPEGSIEWMRAGKGVWHTGEAQPGTMKAFQLWVALAPELENGPSASQYVMPAEVPMAGPVRVILGAYHGMKSPIAAPPMTYLLVSLGDGERWTYQPAEGHTVAWAAVSDGRLHAPAPISSGEMAIFSEGSSSIDFVAEGATRFVIGSAPKHPHELFLGNYSVHTSIDALAEGEAEILRIGEVLRSDGTLTRGRDLAEHDGQRQFRDER
ncbi:MAG: Pirin-related protein [Myxococcaceae bacterium]|nr:Pirin-related protein [Myxococcaceae bacterium]